MTYELIMKIFADYIASDNAVDVLRSKWGYIFIYFDTELAHSGYSPFVDIELCETPEKLYDNLKYSFIEYESEKICDERRNNKLSDKWDEDKELDRASKCAEEKFDIHLKEHETSACTLSGEK